VTPLFAFDTDKDYAVHITYLTTAIPGGEIPYSDFSYHPALFHKPADGIHAEGTFGWYYTGTRGFSLSGVIVGRNYALQTKINGIQVDQYTLYS
jgi:hypothetical protein